VIGVFVKGTRRFFGTTYTGHKLHVQSNITRLTGKHYTMVSLCGQDLVGEDGVPTIEEMDEQRLCKVCMKKKEVELRTIATLLREGV
jgi:hypothetical protein